MARMIPSTIDSGTASPAERLMFDLFRNQLGPDFTVLHSVGWTRRERNRADSDGEADFLVIHPTLGLLVLEVKGGRIIVDGDAGTWVSIDRGGEAHDIHNPFEQAKRNMYSLNQLLRESVTTSGARFAYTCGVAFPDVRIDAHAFGVTVERSMWLDSTALGGIEHAIRGMYGSPGSDRRLGSKDIAAIVDLIRPSREITRLGLMAEMQYGEREVIELTERQYDLLKLLQNRPRARIAGCAGSGKTLLAVEKARRLALQGLDVLLTCYNKGLSAWLRESMERDARPEFRRVTVQHYHDLAMTMCEAAGMPQVVPTGIDSTAFWESDLPQAMMGAIAVLPERRFDAIVVDEGQDFATEWWITLEELLRDPEDGILYIFHDDNQRIYGRAADMPVPELPYSLDSNCRNTKHIHQAVMIYYHDTPKPEPGGPPGRQVDLVAIDRDDLDAIRKVVADLVDREGLSTDQIVVLTPKSAARSSLAEGARIGNRTLTWKADHVPGTVRVSTIHAYKGLESDVVILAETDGLRSNRWQRDMLCYVALSRAKHHVVVIGELPDPEPDPA